MLTVAEGTWLYAGTIPTRVRLLQSNKAFSDEGDEGGAEACPGVCFYVRWEPAGGGAGGAITGPFPTAEEAKAHARKHAGSIEWFTRQ